MTGYILITGSSGDLSVSEDLLFPRQDSDSLCRVPLSDNAWFVAWGARPGDVHRSRKTRGSVLVVDGYVSEAACIPDFGSQQEACDLLLGRLDEDHTFESCSSIAAQIHGSFSMVYVGPGQSAVHCITDRIASRPVWIKRSRDAWAVSSHAVALARLSGSSEYDLGSLGAFLLYAGPVEPTKSIYKGIGAVEEGAVSVLEAGQAPRVRRWYSYRHHPHRSLSQSGWIHLASQRLRDAAARILNRCDSPLVFMSGGTDSRLTAAALRAVGGEPILATLGEYENLEVQVAKRAASALGCRHRIITRDPHWYLRALPEAAHQSGGCFLWTHGHFSEAYRLCRARYGIDVALLGDFCEAFSKLFCVVDNGRTEMWRPEEFLSEFDALRLPLYRPFDRHRTLSLLRPEVRSEVEDRLRQDILARYNRVCGVSDDPLIVGDHFFRWQSATALPTFFMFLDVRNAGPERSIMFDKDVHELLEILPSPLRDHANLGARLVVRLWRPGARAPNSNSLLPLTWPERAHMAARTLRPVLGRLRRLSVENTYRTTGSWPKRSLLYLNDPKWRTFLENVIGQDALFDEAVFDLKAVRNCWQSFCAGDLSLDGDLEKLVQIGVLNLHRQTLPRWTKISDILGACTANQ